RLSSRRLRRVLPPDQHRSGARDHPAGGRLLHRRRLPHHAVASDARQAHGLAGHRRGDARDQGRAHVGMHDVRSRPAPGARRRRCPRCDARLRARKLDAAAWTAALLIAALVLIFPANIYPMNVSNHLGQQVNYTIMTGVQDLFKAGLYPLGVLIFCTSILTPGVKILALGWCVLSVYRGSRRHLVTKTKVLRVIAEMGRWSKT